MTLPDQWQGMGREGMKGMPCLVQQGHHVIYQTYRVHEDEGPTMKMERFAIAARCLSLPAFQIEEAFVDHGLKFPAERRVYLIEHLLGLSHEIGRIGEGTEGFLPVRIHCQVPGAPRPVREPLPALITRGRDRGGGVLLGARGEPLTPGGGVGKRKVGGKDLTPEVPESAVSRWVGAEPIQPEEPRSYLKSIA